MPTAERHLGCKPNVEGSACSDTLIEELRSGKPCS